MEVPKPRTKVDLDGRRLVAIGDVHGDFMQTMKALELAKVMDATGHWIGGTTVLVQVGDILDRGDSELAIMRKFRALAKEAAAAGGEARAVRFPPYVHLPPFIHSFFRSFVHQCFRSFTIIRFSALEAV